MPKLTATIVSQIPRDGNTVLYIVTLNNNRKYRVSRHSGTDGVIFYVYLDMGFGRHRRTDNRSEPAKVSIAAVDAYRLALVAGSDACKAGQSATTNPHSAEHRPVEHSAWLYGYHIAMEGTPLSLTEKYLRDNALPKIAPEPAPDELAALVSRVSCLNNAQVDELADYLETLPSTARSRFLERCASIMSASLNRSAN